MLNIYEGSVTPIRNYGVYAVVNKNSGLVLDVANGLTDDSANVLQYGDSGHAWQRWILVDAGGGYYKIVNQNSNKLLEVHGGSTDNAANVEQYQDNGGAWQLWKPISVGGGYYKLVNYNSGKLLEVHGGSIEYGANVEQFSDNGGTWQLWKLDNPETQSPEIQDKNVLSNVDYATVIALKRTYVYYASKGMHDEMDACLKAIDGIRRKPVYTDRYSNKDLNGLAVSGYSYFSSNPDANVFAIHAHSITAENKLAHDATIVNFAGAILSTILPAPYAALVNAMLLAAGTPDDQLPNLTDAALAALGMQQGVKGWFFTGVGLYVSQNNLSVQIGDIEVVVSMENKDEFGTTQITNSDYLFDSNVNLKTEYYWYPVAIPDM